MVSLVEKEAFFCIDTSQKRLLDFEQIFGNSHPITLEIGSGKGEYIASISRHHPERNFIGVELKSKRIITTLKKLDIERHSNVRLLNLFVDASISEYIPAGSIDEIIIYHPDPWPKSRHHKRRMIQDSFLEALHPIIAPRGYIKISTDSEDYAEWIMETFRYNKIFESVYDTGFTMIPPENHLTTYFDKLQREQGFETIFMKYRKRIF